MPPFGGAVEDRHRGLLVALQSEGHRPEAEPRDLQAGAAEAGVVHDRLPRPGRVGGASRAAVQEPEAAVTGVWLGARAGMGHPQPDLRSP